MAAITAEFKNGFLCCLLLTSESELYFCQCTDVQSIVPTSLTLSVHDSDVSGCFDFKRQYSSVIRSRLFHEDRNSFPLLYMFHLVLPHIHTSRKREKGHKFVTMEVHNSLVWRKIWLVFKQIQTGHDGCSLINNFKGMHLPFSLKFSIYQINFN